MTKKDLTKNINKKIKQLPYFREEVNDEYTKSDEILDLSLSSYVLVNIVRALKSQKFTLTFHDMTGAQTYDLLEFIKKQNVIKEIEKLVSSQIKDNIKKTQELSK
jgi:Asp-tRNA(Asn)/Glu-tRNA(Gln) amidotransferase B subunit